MEYLSLAVFKCNKYIDTSSSFTTTGRSFFNRKEGSQAPLRKMALNSNQLLTIRAWRWLTRCWGCSRLTRKVLNLRKISTFCSIRVNSTRRRLILLKKIKKTRNLKAVHSSQKFHKLLNQSLTDRLKSRGKSKNRWMGQGKKA